jgi:hypothetical protein
MFARAPRRDPEPDAANPAGSGQEDDMSAWNRHVLDA